MAQLAQVAQVAASLWQSWSSCPCLSGNLARGGDQELHGGCRGPSSLSGTMCGAESQQSPWKEIPLAREFESAPHL